MFLDCWRKPKYPERTYKVHTGRSQLVGWFEPKIFLLCGRKKTFQITNSLKTDSLYLRWDRRNNQIQEVHEIFSNLCQNPHTISGPQRVFRSSDNNQILTLAAGLTSLCCRSASDLFFCLCFTYLIVLYYITNNNVESLCFSFYMSRDMFLGMKAWFPEISFPLRTWGLVEMNLRLNRGYEALWGFFFFFFCEILMKTENAVFLWPLLCKVACPFLCQHATFNVVGVWGKEKVVQHKQLSM